MNDTTLGVVESAESESNAEESESDLESGKHSEKHSEKPNCLQVWCFGCCRPQVRKKTKECCGTFWKGFLKLLIGIIILGIFIFLMPWITGNLVTGATSSTAANESCWTMPNDKWFGSCWNSYGIGFGVFWCMIVPFVFLVICGVILLKNKNNNDFTLTVSETRKYQKREIRNIFILCCVIFWIAFPSFIGAVGGFRLGMNHLPNCQYWQNDFENNIEYRCTIDDPKISAALNNGFCQTYTYFCCPSGSGQCWDCNDAENAQKNRQKCSRKLEDQCYWCKGTGWSAIAFPVWFFPLILYMLYGIGYGIVKLCKHVYGEYQSWKTVLEKQINEPRNDDTTSSGHGNFDLEANTMESQMSGSTIVLVKK